MQKHNRYQNWELAHILRPHIVPYDHRAPEKRQLWGSSYLNVVRLCRKTRILINFSYMKLFYIEITYGQKLVDF